VAQNRRTSGGRDGSPARLTVSFDMKILSPR
jgi:hypothetical protein